MSYTVSIKEEIVKIKNSNAESIAELAGYIRNNGVITNKKVTMTTENKMVVDHLVDSLKNIYNTNAKVEIIENLNFSKKDLYQITIEENLSKILEKLGIWDKDHKYLGTVPDYIVGGNEEIRAYLRGVFEGVGSVNDPKTSRYHMELLISKSKEAVFVQKLLNIFELNAKILGRDKGYMIYIKEAEKISDFLKIIGANKAVLYFEDIRIYRDHANMINRINNCEQANIDKIINTAFEQIKSIEKIEEKASLDILSSKEKEVAIYRKKYPDVSLVELSEIMTLETGNKITKSGVYHRLNKIKEIADKISNV